ncbi:hypothetical protein THAOC_36057 [Thalassiosira oceanica]|uniref:Uncharacterized protein n=1 Tax=Thalassiosira oceanica TaxID=159749 RepID=K0RFI5_THAOC|nr:hypothetical protein THAOC_36057 [Thalassiosira oceanica]|eukprot:EJK45332.1 hypothetical protein THAOC_36057 [Thalassiosira oceanica]
MWTEEGVYVDSRLLHGQGKKNFADGAEVEEGIYVDGHLQEGKVTFQTEKWRKDGVYVDDRLHKGKVTVQEEGIFVDWIENESQGKVTFVDGEVQEEGVYANGLLCWTDRIRRSAGRQLDLSIPSTVTDLPTASFNGCINLVFSEAMGVSLFHTEDETTGRLQRALQWIAFHELKESSILIEPAMWKLRIDSYTELPRVECRVAVPGPAKTAIMEYCGFTDLLKPASDCV